jgi:signal peptidase
VRRALATAALVALTALAATMLVPPILGYERYVVEGGSMGGALPRGSIAFEEVVPTSDLRAGDVITYRPPGANRPITHRIASITAKSVFRTKGDANATADPWTFTLPHEHQARLAFHLPLAGYAIEALELKPLRMALIGGPALAIAVASFAAAARPRRRPRHLSFG